jgi:hypothetical protein
MCTGRGQCGSACGLSLWLLRNALTGSEHGQPEASPGFFIAEYRSSGVMAFQRQAAGLGQIGRRINVKETN